MKVAALFHHKARARVNGLRLQQGLLQQLREARSAPRLWIHAASLGEFEQARPIIEQWNDLHPDWDIIVSFFSPSGYEHRKHYTLAKAVLYLPPDMPHAMKAITDALQPDLVVIIKYEFWLNWLAELHRQQIPVLLAAGRFYPAQPFFRWYGGSFREALTWFTQITVLDSNSQAILHKLHPQLPVSLVPDTRFDRVTAVAKEQWHDDVLASFCGRHRVMVAGSVWPADLRLLQQAITAFPDIRWIIVPHIVDEAHIRLLQRWLPEKSLRYSTAEVTTTNQVMVLDKMGLLSKAYRYGMAAYVGGGFGAGIHSILEPAAYGIPVAFGPNHHTFPEAQELLQAGAAQVLHTAGEAITWVQQMTYDTEKTACGNAASAYIARNTGGTARIISLMEECITA